MRCFRDRKYSPLSFIDRMRSLKDLHQNLKAHDKLLATVIMKESYFQATPFEAPVQFEIRTDESGAVAFADRVRSETPACKDESSSALNTLSAKFEKANNAYSD